MARPSWLAIVIIAACGGGSGDPPDADPDLPDAGPGGCTDDDLHSHFRAAPDSAVLGRYGSQAGGWITDGKPPQIIGAVSEAGGCRFLAPQPALCNPACSGTSVCDIHGACIDYPEYVSGGTATITGTTPTITMEPSFNYYNIDMGHPGLYAPGAVLVLDVEGGPGVDPIHIETVGIPSLELPTDQLTAREHQDLVVAFTAVTGVPGTEIVLQLNNDHHAGPHHVICTADAAAGSVTVPAAILDELIEAGENGIGTYIESAWIEQRKRGYTTSARGCAAFDAQSDRFVTVDTIRAP